jgi:guanylate kinase
MPRNPDSGARPRWLREPWPADLRYLPRRNRVFVISGPAGVGKDTLIAELLGVVADLHKVVTWTTKPLVAGQEQAGVDYCQCTPDDFARMVAAGELLEFAEYNESFYGTPTQALREAFAAGLDVLLKIEAQGAMKVKARLPGAVLIFIAPERKDELRERMIERGRDDADAIARRLKRADSELSLAGLYDYVVVNRSGRLGAAVAQVKAIVEAERLRASPHPIDLELG